MNPEMMNTMMQEPAGGLLDQAPEVSRETIEQLSDHISDYLHGPARDHIAQALSQSGDDLDETIAATTYQTMTEASQQIAEIDPAMVTLDVLMPLTAETIDYMIEIAEAVGAPIADPDDVRARAFLKTIEIHMSNPEVADDPEQQQIAREYLAEMMEDGTFGEAERFVEDRIKAEGGDPARARAQAEQMLQPRQDPLAAGVRQGVQQNQGIDPAGGLL